MDGTIFLWKRSNKKFDIVGRAIEYFTGSPYTHVAVFLRGSTFESTIWTPKGEFWPKSGIKQTGGFVHGYCVKLKPVKSLTSTEVDKMLLFSKMQMDNRRPYNILKLVVLALVYPTRWFWNKINWVPFQADFFGEVCSTFVDQVYKAAKRDLFPERGEEATVPGDFVKTNQLEIVND
jgi:hypothetical protein